MRALAIDVMPRFVACILEEHPRVDVSLRGSNSNMVMDRVAAGQCQEAVQVMEGAAWEDRDSPRSCPKR